MMSAADGQEPLSFQVLHRLKSTAPNVKVELYMNTDPIDPAEDKKIIAQMPLRDKMASKIWHSFCMCGDLQKFHFVSLVNIYAN